ncbi:MAG: pantoate--beta-alanine ligase [Flavobacterium sp.]
MLIFNKQSDLIAHLESQNSIKIGFVPTMGALHQGHLTLMNKAMSENDLTVVSIFVNPTQFNSAEDLAKYPRSLESDVEKIAHLSDKIVVYAPEVSDVYGENAVSEQFDFDGIENQMEGKFRAGHFDGVGTVLKRFFEIVKPTNAYFGEKDFQQLAIVKKLVSKYNIPVTIVGCPIHREESGLAMSSRNERLSAENKKEATLISRTLYKVKEDFGKKPLEEIVAEVSDIFDKNPHFTLEYFEIANAETLLTATEIVEGQKYQAFIAVFINNIRLIDTISLN